MVNVGWFIGLEKEVNKGYIYRGKRKEERAKSQRAKSQRAKEEWNGMEWFLKKT